MAEEALALGGPSPFGTVPTPPEAKKSIFGGSKPAPGPSLEVLGLTEQLNGLAARIRVSEERSNELRKKLLFIEQNMLSNHKKLIGDLKESNGEIDEVRHKLAEVEDRVITIIKELRLTARKSDMDVMRRYIELWDPVKFVNAEQVERIVRDILEEQGMLLKDDQNI